MIPKNVTTPAKVHRIPDFALLVSFWLSDEDDAIIDDFSGSFICLRSSRAI